MKTIAAVLFVAGVVVLTYPFTSQIIFEIKANKIIAAFDARTEEYSEEEKGELYKRMVAYNRMLFEEGQDSLNDPFVYEQVDFSLKAFGFDEEMIGYLSIPQMGIELPIYLGANRENLSNGAAHLTKTSLPIGGVNTNAVVAGHRGMRTAAMFRDIEKLEVGASVYITNYWETLAYRVVEVKVITPDAFEEILIQQGRDLVTLITCHPYGFNYKRYVVYAERINESQ